MLDVREEILKSVRAKLVTASILAEEEGIVAGTSAARREIDRLGLCLSKIVADGFRVRRGDEVARFGGSPRQVVMAEETVIGLLAKPSGIASSAGRFVAAAGGRPKVVCGAWKKMPPPLKDMIREAIRVGGASPRIVDGPFAYLDKNYVELLGGVGRTLAAVAHLTECAKVIQVKGRYGDIVSEACEAARSGADIVFVDSGDPGRLPEVTEELCRLGLRRRVKIAFGGGIHMEDMEGLKALDIDILDIGRRIVDAPILDMRMEMVEIGP